MSDERDVDIYDEVTEKEYQTIQREREELQDFVVNDEGEAGHVGDDIGDGGLYSDEDDEEPSNRKGSSRGGGRGKNASSRIHDNKSKNIRDLFDKARNKSAVSDSTTTAAKSGPGTPMSKHRLPSSTPSRKRQTDESEEDFMKSLFSGLDSEAKNSPSLNPLSPGIGSGSKAALSAKRRKLAATNPYIPTSPLTSFPNNPYSKGPQKKSRSYAATTPAHLVDRDTTAGLSGIESIKQGFSESAPSVSKPTTEAEAETKPSTTKAGGSNASNDKNDDVDDDDDDGFMDIDDLMDADIAEIEASTTTGLDETFLPEDSAETSDPKKPPSNVGTDDTSKPTSKLFKVDNTDATDWLSFANNMSANYDNGDDSEMTTESQTDSISVPTATAADTSDKSSLLLYWIDAFERNGIVYLIGKTYIPTQKKFQSCCLVVRNIERNVFLLPRQISSSSSTPSSQKQQQQQQPADMDNVEAETKMILRRHGITKYKSKSVARKYNFEIPGIPSETQYLKISYPFQGTEQLPHDLNGTSFSHVFGTTYSALELLLLKRRIMGPCWLRIQNISTSSPQISWCRQEYVVENPKNIFVLSDDDVDKYAPCPVPPFSVMTCSVKTVLNHKENSNEIVAASLMVHNEYKLDDLTPIQQQQQKRRGIVEHYTAIRQLEGIPFPPGFQTMCNNKSNQQQQKAGGAKIEIHKNERSLLSYILALLYKFDPDVVVGHNFLGFDLDVLLHRMKACRVEGWSKIGRLRRTVWPKLQAGAGGMGDSTFSERQIMAGRIICDTYLVSKDLIKSKSYSLTQLALGELKIVREDLPFERIPEYFGSAQQLFHFVQHTGFDAFLCCALMHKIQALPLTKQLTHLAGNLWTRTLTGARAERNEYLLLHEFYRNKYIRPDKLFANQRNNQKDASGNNNNNKKKAAGGGGGGGVATTTTVASSSSADASAVMDSAQDNEIDDEAIAQMLANGDGESSSTASASGSGPSANASASSGASRGRRKPAYVGGLVLDPKKGFYDHYVLLLDFNSLYPSIIQEFNICFTTVIRPDDPESIPDPPDPSLPTGILPKLLKTLVDRRRQVKQLLKAPNLDSEKQQQLDIRQKALKLTANSMYGCLGFTHSRFYARPLAMLITSKGREVLQSTKSLAESEHLEVIYGDTDSIMIHTNSDDLKMAYEIGHAFKRKANERYRLLELDIDGVFQRMLLLKKKKYAALLVKGEVKSSASSNYKGKNNSSSSSGGGGGGGEPKLITEIETKGLDLVRRDWCELSHDVSNYALKAILSGDDREDVINRIHNYLGQVGEEIRNDRVPLEKYLINKGLTKNPEQYPDAKSQPHVQVALRLKKKGIYFRAGDTVPYIITAPPTDNNSGVTGNGSGGGGGSFAERACHPDEIRNSEGKLVVDKDWYLNQQVLPPLDRLCDPIEGTNMALLAQNLGLDPAKFRHYSSSSGSHNDGSSGNGDELKTLDSQISDAERFRFADPLQVKCRGCQCEYSVDGIVRLNMDEEDNKKNDGSANSTKPQISSGIQCPKCQSYSTKGQLASILSLQIRSHINKFYQGWTICDEASCEHETQRLHPLARRCTQQGCTGTVRQKYTDKALYNQLLYYSSLFQLEKSIRRTKPSNIEPLLVKRLYEQHQDVHNAMYEIIEQYLQLSARRYVNLSNLFQFCKI
ncbi:DNA-directed DNA polymerase alpha catalytic subunit pol1 [Mycoemilia scoparia]|uniref:DNA polymerase n=1 Tax=Mycoemilia scoparia TaxID=417184 RepID=A0A9W8A0P2_9FUNG|nr:DNA-directed DNA polymerase alpha catalytic subunit pol1 [Mycoemilia scoparia]